MTLPITIAMWAGIRHLPSAVALVMVVFLTLLTDLISVSNSVVKIDKNIVTDTNTNMMTLDDTPPVLGACLVDFTSVFASLVFTFIQFICFL